MRAPRRIDSDRPGPARAALAVLIATVVASGLASCGSGGTARDEAVEDDRQGSAIADEALVDTGGDVVLRMRTVGPADAADTLIAVHGGPGLSLEAMEGYESLAGPERRVVSYDQRGAGRSSVPGDLDYSLDAQVADLEAIRTALGAESVQLLGQSWGGAIAAAYAAVHPDRVDALVLVGAVPLDVEVYLAGQLRFQARVAELQQLGIIDDVIPSIDEGSCAAAFSSVLPAYLDEPTSDISVAVASCTAETSRATYEAFLADETVPVHAAELSTFDSPTLLVAGDNDVFGPDWLERHRELLGLAPTDSVLIPEAGHLVIAEQPDATLAGIAAFLRQG